MVERVAVIGLGTMGHGIAQTFALAGCKVVGFDDHPAAAASLHDRVQRNLLQFVDADLTDPEEIAPTLARLSVATSEEDAVRDAEFVVEAVREDLPTKQALLARIERVVSRETVLASNSSTFPISQSGRLLQHPDRAVVAHWFNPPHIVPTVEVVPGPATSEATVDTTVDLLRRAGKLPVRINKEVPGFLVNRVQVALFREVWDLLRQGVATPEEIDAAILGSMGFRLAALGPLTVQDFGGLDVQTTVYRNLVPEVAAGTEIPPVVQEIVDRGDFGVKTGRGFYDYSGDAAQHATDERDRRFLQLLKLFRERQDATAV